MEIFGLYGLNPHDIKYDSIRINEDVMYCIRAEFCVLLVISLSSITDRI